MNAIVIENMSISLGDILGSNITNIALVLGVCFIVAARSHSRKKRIAIEKKDVKQFTNGLILLSGTLLTLLYLQYISTLIGILLLAVFFIYSFNLFRKRKEDRDHSNNHADRRIRKELILIAVGIVGVIIGSRFTVDSAMDIATSLGISASIIGATLVALGTTLPELAVDVRAAYAGHLDICVGDIVGSCFMNSTLVLGLLLIFTPFTVNLAVLSDLLLFSVVSNLILWYFLDNRKVGYRAGVILLLLYTVNLLSILEILVFRVT
jgi:cation:H+ antiporter